MFLIRAFPHDVTKAAIRTMFGSNGDGEDLGLVSGLSGDSQRFIG
jgi:hypothetical protein